MNSASGSTASASSSGAPLLFVGANWIGDTLMSMPAVQAWRRAHPGARLGILARGGCADLWRLHAAPDEVLVYGRDTFALRATVDAIRRGEYGRAAVLPNSFRAAFPPFLARVPERIAFRGRWRSALLTRIVDPPSGRDREHQAWEAMALLAPGPAEARLDAPAISIPDRARETITAIVRDLPRPILGAMPGAARGPAKRWPTERFAEVAADWVRRAGGSVVAMGGPEDAAACAALIANLGSAARNLAGRTKIDAWAAALAACDVVVCNDSGGMHLAAAVGAPVVAVFGATDPRRTAPVGGRVRVLQAEGGRSRDVARASGEAEKRLAAISARAVYDAAQEMWGRG